MIELRGSEHGLGEGEARQGGIAEESHTINNTARCSFGSIDVECESAASERNRDIERPGLGGRGFGRR